MIRALCSVHCAEDAQIAHHERTTESHGRDVGTTRVGAAAPSDNQPAQCCGSAVQPTAAAAGASVPYRDYDTVSGHSAQLPTGH